MTVSKEIKKALKATFPTIKFSVTTQKTVCETVTVEWTGGPFVNQVSQVCQPWNTFKNHSDVMTDYFHYTGIDIKYERSLSNEEIEMLKEEIPKHYPTIINGRSLEWCEYNIFAWIKENELDWRNDFGYRLLSANKAIALYLETGSIEVPEEDKVSERILLSRLEYTYFYKYSQSNVIESPTSKGETESQPEQEFNDTKNIQIDNLKTRYEQWVMSLIEKGQSAKIISFEDWKAIADFILT